MYGTFTANRSVRIEHLCNAAPMWICIVSAGLFHKSTSGKKETNLKKNIYIKTAMNEQAGNEVIWHEFYTYVQNWPVVGWSSLHLHLPLEED